MVQKKPQCLLLKWNRPPGRQAQMVSHTSLLGGPVGSGRRGWAPRHWRSLFESDCFCWTRWLLFVQAVWGTQGRHGTVALSSGVKPACARSLPSGQLAEYLRWDPAGGWQDPAEGNIWPTVVTKCPHHPRLHQAKHYLPRCGTQISSRRPFFRR